MSGLISSIIYLFLLFISFKFLLFLFKFNSDSKPLILVGAEDITPYKQEIIIKQSILEAKYKNPKKDIKLLDLKEILKKNIKSKKCK